MSETRLPIDRNGSAIPAMRFVNGSGKSIDATTTESNRTPANFTAGCTVVSIYGKVDGYVAFGDENIVADATSTFVPAETWIDVAVASEQNGSDAAKRMAVRAVTANGKWYVSERA